MFYTKTSTTSEADHRLLSKVMDEPIQFADEAALAIDDVLINRNTGEIGYFTVAMDADSCFDENLRAIPAAEVEIGAAGQVSTSISLAELDTDQQV